MANQDNPIGVRPLTMLDGSQIPVRRFIVDSGNGTNLGIGDVVETVAAGAVNKITDFTANPTRIVGAVIGLEDSNGVAIGGPNSTVSTKYLPLSTAGFAYVALALPNATFVAQVATGQTPAEADIFSASDLVAGTLDTTTALSRNELAALSTGQANCRVIGKIDDPSNAWGEHVDCVITFIESIWNGASAGV